MGDPRPKPRCTGPECTKDGIRKGLCPAHRKQQLRGTVLHPLRAPRPADTSNLPAGWFNPTPRREAKPDPEGFDLADIIAFDVPPITPAQRDACRRTILGWAARLPHGERGAAYHDLCDALGVSA